MNDCELLALRDELAKRNNFLDISNEFLIELVHSALSFEQYDLKKEEVAKVLANDIEGINEKKVLLITNQKNAFLHIVKIAGEKVEMTEDTLKDLHQTLMNGFSNIGGLYRNVDISVKGSNHTPPSHIKVYDRMKKYFDHTLYTEVTDIFEYISYAHLQLAKIHPFLDGNGRCARLVLNYQLMKNGFMPVIITPDQRDKYFTCLESFKVEKEIKPFIEYLKELEVISLKKYAK